MRWIRAAFLVAALAVMVLPCALMPFAPSTIGAENRLPAAWPALADENGVNYAFPGQYEDWLRDHVALRGTWIGLYSRALRALGASSEPQVILGKGDWLFFRETLNDYTGAEPLTDGMRYYIPSRSEREEGKLYEDPQDQRVNLNTATREELMTLSGIGQTRAENILAYREAHGKFRSIEELTEVSGISEGILSQIKDQIRVK